MVPPSLGIGSTRESLSTGNRTTREGCTQVKEQEREKDRETPPLGMLPLLIGENVQLLGDGTQPGLALGHQTLGVASFDLYSKSLIRRESSFCSDWNIQAWSPELEDLSNVPGKAWQKLQE